MHLIAALSTHCISLCSFALFKGGHRLSLPSFLTADWSWDLVERWLTEVGEILKCKVRSELPEALVDLNMFSKSLFWFIPVLFQLVLVQPSYRFLALFVKCVTGAKERRITGFRCCIMCC